ncbi:MAG: DMT family transporter [Clostridia bacterium]|nr:DMT family transporter [Clostridia bacterium]
MNKKSILGIVLLLITAFIWGLAFIAQTKGMENVEPFTFSATRMLLGGIALLPMVIFLDYRKLKSADSHKAWKHKKARTRSIINGCIIGVVFCVACNFQQFALVYSSAGKVAFITAFYMLLVPIFSLLLRYYVPPVYWLSSVIGLAGLFFLCVKINNFQGFNRGDVYALIGAVFFAIHILLIESFVKNTDGLRLSCTQLLVGGIISLIPMFIFENPSWQAIGGAIIPIIYAGIFSCGIAYTLQIIGQKYVEPSIATLVMSSESVFAVILSSIILKETMDVFEIIGCVIMAIAIVLPQVFEIVKNRKV